MAQAAVATAPTDAVPAQHHELDGTLAECLALAIAPSTGRFRPLARPGQLVEVGALLGHVTGGRDRADEIRSPHAGVVRSLLARTGQLVQTGRPLLWIDAQR